MKHEKWTIAFRRKNRDECLLDNLKKDFKLIPNTWRYWCADPHLFEYEGHTYIFAELYDRVLRRGVIGCCEIVEEKVTPWKVVLKMPYHLSYPHLIQNELGIYMIPESYVAKEIAVFQAKEFPYKWEKLAVLKDNFVAVDSTLLMNNAQDMMLTLEFDGNNEYFKRFFFDEQKNIISEELLAENDMNKRPAGNLFEWSEKLIRPAQDCSAGYGSALNFYEVTNLEYNAYREELIKKIKPSDIKTNCKDIPQGIHTYNQNEQYEVIDLKHYEIDILFYIVRPIWYVWRRVQKVLLK